MAHTSIVDERRHLHDRRADNCLNHEMNTQDISSLKTTTRIIAWIMGLMLPFGTAMVLFFMNSLNVTLREFKGDISALTEIVYISKTEDATTRTKVENLEKEIQIIKQWMEDNHPAMHGMKAH